MLTRGDVAKGRGHQGMGNCFMPHQGQGRTVFIYLFCRMKFTTKNKHRNRGEIHLLQSMGIYPQIPFMLWSRQLP